MANDQVRLRRQYPAGESEPLIQPNTQPLRQFKLSTMCVRSWSFKQISLAEAAATFDIPTLASLVRQHLHEIWGRNAVSVIWGYKMRRGVGNIRIVTWISQVCIFFHMFSDVKDKFRTDEKPQYHKRLS